MTEILEYQPVHIGFCHVRDFGFLLFRRDTAAVQPDLAAWSGRQPLPFSRIFNPAAIISRQIANLPEQNVH